MEGEGGHESRLVWSESCWREQVGIRVDWYVMRDVGGSRWA